MNLFDADNNTFDPLRSIGMVSDSIHFEDKTKITISNINDKLNSVKLTQSQYKQFLKAYGERVVKPTLKRTLAFFGC